MQILKWKIHLKNRIYAYVRTGDEFQIFISILQLLMTIVYGLCYKQAHLQRPIATTQWSIQKFSFLTRTVRKEGECFTRNIFEGGESCKLLHMTYLFCPQYLSDIDFYSALIRIHAIIWPVEKLTKHPVILIYYENAAQIWKQIHRVPIFSDAQLVHVNQ